MSRFNTGNPIGSADPRDRDDNSKNLDEAVNTQADRWTDRLGNERVSLAAAVDPSGFAQSALNDANRAEAAADAAFVNADVYDDVAAGLASGDTQFQVVEGAEVVRYRNESGSAVEVARYPASEFVNIALDVASQPGLVSGEFYADDSDQPVYSITDEDGNALAAWNERGEMDVDPSQELSEKVQRARGEFHTADDQPAFALTDEDGRPLYAVDENGQPIVPFISEFHTEDGQPAFAWTDKKGVIFYGIDEEGRNVVGGGEGEGVVDEVSLLWSESPYSEIEGEGGALYRLGDGLNVTREYGPLYSQTGRQSLPSLAAMYDYFDDLVDRYPDYVSRELRGADGLGNEIYAYHFVPAAVSRISDVWAPFEYRPKFLVSLVVHGNEQGGALPGVKFFTEMCDRWREDSLLGKMRWGAEFIVVPAMNASGLDANTRKNHNGVDLNRNFPADWSEAGSTTPSNSSYRGPSAASELETQIMMDLTDEHLDCIAYLDLHNHGSLTSRGAALWLGVNNEKAFYTALSVNARCTEALRRVGKEIRVEFDDNSPLNRITSSSAGTMARWWSKERNLNGILVEASGGLASDRRTITWINYLQLRVLIDELFERHLQEKIALAPSQYINTTESNDDD